MLKRARGLLLCAIAAIGTTPVGAQDTSYSAADAVMLQARELVRTGRWDALRALLPQTASHPAGVYAEYWWVRQQIRSGTPEAIEIGQRFLAAQQGNYIAERLRADWAMDAAQSGQENILRLLADGAMAADEQARCAALLGRHLNAIPVAADAVQAYVPGPSCDRLLDRLVADRELGWEQIRPLFWQRIEDNQPQAARSLAQRFLPGANAQRIEQAIEQPGAWLDRQNPARLSDADQDLVTAALGRMARTDMLPGWERTERWAAQLPPASLAWVRGQYGRMGSIRLHPQAHGWFVQAGLDAPLSTDVRAHRVRAALRQARIDWSWVRQSIEAMPPEQARDPAWTYWRARALQASGQSAAAVAAYESIATQFNFYGQLAAEELGHRIMLPPQAAAPTTEERRAAREHAGLRRAIALMNLGWRVEANREWNYSLRGMTDRQLLAAAHLALENDWLDRVVNTADRTRQEHDFTLRFLTPFRDELKAKAEQIGVDPSWVYGLIRQESRFIRDARSRVGASGLMQLMPATARYTARRMGLSNFQPHQVNELDTNLTLGTGYLRMVQDDLDGSMLLATAGYNAGPGRPRNWRASLQAPVEGAIFAETIPFNETRDYVQKVLSNKTYYAALFTGQPQSLKARLGRIEPRAAGTTNLP